MFNMLYSTRFEEMIILFSSLVMITINSDADFIIPTCSSVVWSKCFSSTSRCVFPRANKLFRTSSIRSFAKLVYRTKNNRDSMHNINMKKSRPILNDKLLNIVHLDNQRKGL